MKNKECNQADDYLTGKLGYKPIFKHALSLKVKGVAFTCNISNKATIATLKDIDIRVKFISKTKAVILEEVFTVYEFISPGKAIEYKNEISMSNQDYKDISDMEWSIIKASCK